MFCCHSDSRLATILASFSGCAAIRCSARRARSHPSPLANQRAVARRFHLEPPRRADTVGPDDVPHPAALILDFDDLAHRLPCAESVMLAAAAEPGTDRDGVGIVQPFHRLELRRALRGQTDVGDVIPRSGDIAATTLGHFYRGLIAVAHRCSMPRTRGEAARTTGKGHA